MKRDIILAGVGGQGILTIATVIGYAAVERGLFLKQSEVHGMSQRGGEVQSHLRISDTEVFSDLVPEGGADLIIGVEPMESLRYYSYLKPGEGWLITNKKPFVNIPNYPDFETLWNRISSLPRAILIDGDTIAREHANARAVNIVVLGAASDHVGLPVEDLRNAIRVIFARKGDAVVEANLRAFDAGRAFAGSWGKVPATA
ncbi:MAG: indolepyruvate oxidoreductase subunit beta [Bacteroidota bacterium]|nr:indolepyruvate oxidoreductase subunit beta [Bacteroidota bacterium]